MTGTSKRFLHHRKAGLTIPRSVLHGNSAQGCWCPLPPSVFKLRGENFFRHASELLPSDIYVFINP